MKTIYGVKGMQTIQVDIDIAARQRAAAAGYRADIERLADFIDTNFPGELGADDLSSGANVVDVAIQILEQMTMWMAG